VDPLVQIGALLVLRPLTLAQAPVVTPETRIYLSLNLVGAGVLTVEAYIQQQWGLLLLEGAWAVIAAWGLLRRRDFANLVADHDRAAGEDVGAKAAAMDEILPLFSEHGIGWYLWELMIGAAQTRYQWPDRHQWPLTSSFRDCSTRTERLTVGARCS
jgi:hypothetical protein